ncbi:hypothetical protein ANN_02544 [Periplaneta americana]|uniref:Mos1 transposase HTH domain-containing protein n=1 Tax=Periplaneta americana TaxID=6978 RepID=A0ABQ8TWP0_PERAM|nr:hypothetical protein ANN_02544 [Periplaneta americana]
MKSKRNANTEALCQYVIHISPSAGLNTCRLLTHEYRQLQKKHYNASIPQMRSTGFLNMCSHNVVSTGCNKSPLCILCYFKMNDVIDNLADCEVRSVIRFLNARHFKSAEIYRQLKEVYGDTVMNERNVRKWCEMFNNGRTNVHDETRPGRPSLITEDLKTKVNDRILQDRRTSLDELHIAFPDISRSLLGEIFLMLAGSEFQSLGRAIVKEDEYEEITFEIFTIFTLVMNYTFVRDRAYLLVFRTEPIRDANQMQLGTFSFIRCVRPGSSKDHNINYSSVRYILIPGKSSMPYGKREVRTSVRRGPVQEHIVVVPAITPR